MIDLEKLQVEGGAQTHLSTVQWVFERLAYGGQLKLVHLAYGSVIPPRGATATQSPRIVVSLSGDNMMVVPEGDGTREITLHPYDAVFVSAEAWNLTLHKCRNTFMTLDFSLDHIRYFCKVKYPGESRNEPWFMYRRKGQPERHIGHTLSALELLCQDYGDTARPAARGLIISLVQQAYDVLKHESDTGYTTPRGRWEVVREFIEDRLHEPITRDDVASTAAVHPNHLSRLVKQFSGMAYITYLNERRLNRAAGLLTTYRLSVKEVGARCGYTTPAHFSTAFRKRFGLAPGAYRKRAAAQPKGIRPAT